MKLSIIFVNWNSTNYIRECLASIYQHASGVEFEIVVVDNASPIQDVDSLRDEFLNLKLLKSAKNLGFAAANNLGFKYSQGEYILFLNPDTKLIGPAIQKMLSTAESLPDAGIIGCRLLNDDFTVQTSCIQKFPTILNQALDAEFFRQRWPNSRLWGMRPLFIKDHAAASRVEVISGACMMVKREVLSQVGSFSEDYFMYAEDLDLCYKLVQARYANYFVGQTEIIHYGGRSSSPASATVMKWRSVIRYCSKNRGPVYTICFRFVLALVAITRLMIIQLCLAAKTEEEASADFSVLMKWKAILRTLLTESGRSRPSGLISAGEPGTLRSEKGLGISGS